MKQRQLKDTLPVHILHFQWTVNSLVQEIINKLNKLDKLMNLREFALSFPDNQAGQSYQFFGGNHKVFATRQRIY